MHTKGLPIFSCSTDLSRTVVDFLEMMKLIKKMLLNQSQATLDYPFGADVMVFRIKNKIFAILSLGKKIGAQPFYWLNLKCDPNEALILRDIFDAIIPGYHMNKRHWNTIILDGSVPQGEIERLIENSYQLVALSLTKEQQKSLMNHSS